MEPTPLSGVGADRTMTEPHVLAYAITALLAALIRSALLSDDAATAARRQALDAHEAVRVALDGTNGADHLGTLKLDGLWALAKSSADMPELGQHALQVSRQLADACPLTLGDLVGPGLAMAELEERIRDAASTG